jgi:hypothetical protein
MGAEIKDGQRKELRFTSEVNTNELIPLIWGPHPSPPVYRQADGRERDGVRRDFVDVNGI